MLMKASDIHVDDKLASAAALVDSLRDQAGEISRQRCIPEKVLHSLADAGIMNLLRPERFGGKKASLKTAIKVSRELARGDASVAWVHGVFMTHDHVVGLFPEEFQDEYWHSSDLPLTASSVVPAGKAVPVDGGYRLTGSWSFCSGVDHANWVVVCAITGMIANETPLPDRRFFMVPSSDFTIVDDWDVLGLRGTGSKSVTLQQVFVPNVRIVRDIDIVNCCAPGARTHAANEFKYSAWPLLAFTLVGLAAKIAENAYESAIAELHKGKDKPNPLFEIRRPAAAMHLAEASAKIDAADLIFTRALEETFSVVEAGAELSIQLRVRNRRDQCFAAKLSHEAASMLLGIGGARGIREGGAVQRAHRDLTALTLHPASNWDATALSYGNVALGGAPTEPIV